MIEPNGYILIKIRNRSNRETSKKVLLPKVHPLMFCVYREEDVYSDLVDAIIAKGKSEYPEDHIILPYW